MTPARTRPYTTVRAARFVQQGRSRSHSRPDTDNRLRELARMPIERSPRPEPLVRSIATGVLTVLGIALLIVVAGMAS